MRTGGERHLVSLQRIRPAEYARQLMEVLDYFDGRPTAEAVQAIYDEKDFKFDARPGPKAGRLPGLDAR